MRLKKLQAERVKDGLVASLSKDDWRCPDALPNHFGGIWISDQQKRAYLYRLMLSGKIMGKWHQRGWFKWYLYRQNDEIPF